MIRTQVQLPSELHERAKRFAEDREMSLAEVVRRGLELLLDRYPAVTPDPDEWVFPTFDGGLKVPLEDLRYYSRDLEAYRSLPEAERPDVVFPHPSERDEAPSVDSAAS